jgi:hypothetical protein
MTFKLTEIESRPHNTGFASGGVTCKLGALCFYASSVQVDSLVLRNPPERKARKRCASALTDKQQKNIKHKNYDRNSF